MQEQAKAMVILPLLPSHTALRTVCPGKEDPGLRRGDRGGTQDQSSCLWSTKEGRWGHSPGDGPLQVPPDGGKIKL